MQREKQTDDLISRQDAIKDAESWVAVDEYEKHLQKNVIEWLKELPSAQPEPERFKSCKNCIHLGHGYMMPCKNCRRNQVMPDWYEVET